MHEINTNLLHKSEGPTALSVDAVENDSDFARIISLTRIHSAQTRSDFGFTDTSSAFVHRTDEQVSCRIPWQTYPSYNDHKGCNFFRTYCCTVIAGTCMILHLCFTWFSYSSEIWSESLLIVTTSLPFVPAQRYPLRLFNLQTLFVRLKDSSGVVAFTIIWSTTFIGPILFLLLLPVWIFPSLQNHVAMTNSTKFFLQRMIRWPMTVVFVHIIFAFNDHGITIQLSHSLFAIGTKISEGLTSYILGNTFAIISVASLCLSDAFELPQGFSDPSCISMIESAEDQPSEMYALEESSHPVVIRTAAPVRFLVLPGEMERISPHALLPFWKIFLVSQTGILSFLLLAISFFLTTLRFEYEGTATELIDSPNVSLSFYQMTLSFYGDSICAGTSRWRIRYLGIILISFSFVCPFVAFVLSVLTWFASPVDATSCLCNRKRFKRYLNVIHPAVGGIVFSVALLLLHSNLSTVDVEGSVLRTTSRTLFLNKQLLYISGKFHLESGFWVFFAHSILLEAFISFTKSWS